MMKNPVCNEEKPPPPLPRETQTSHPRRFSALLAKYKLQNGINGKKWMTIASQAMQKMNPTLTLLIMTVTMAMKCAPDYPKHGALNSLHDMTYYK